MLEVLKKCCETKKPVSLYVDPDRPTAFRYGEVLAVNGEELLTLMVSPEGNYDGLLLLSTPDIYRIEVDTQYNKRMEILTKPFEKPALQSPKRISNRICLAILPPRDGLHPFPSETARRFTER